MSNESLKSYLAKNGVITLDEQGGLIIPPSVRGMMTNPLPKFFITKPSLEGLGKYPSAERSFSPSNLGKLSALAQPDDPKRVSFDMSDPSGPLAKAIYIGLENERKRLSEHKGAIECIIENPYVIMTEMLSNLDRALEGKHEG